MRRAHRLHRLALILAIATPPVTAGAQVPVAPPPPVRADAPPANDMTRAADELRERLATATAANAPRLTNAGAALVRRAFDRDALRAMPLELGAVSGTCGAIGRTLVAYMQFAERVTGGNDGDAANRQALAMQDEVTLGLAAGNVCVQRSLRAADALVRSSAPAQPERAREGLKQMRRGAAQAIRGSVDAALSGMSAKNRDLVLSAILEDASTVAASFPQAERNELRTMILTRMARATGTDRAKLQAIANAYGGSACNALCRFAGAN